MAGSVQKGKRSMAEKATKITRVEIQGLWDRYDLVWNLRPDVNILAGVNGSGKSTILNCVSELFHFGGVVTHYKDSIHKLQVWLDNGFSYTSNIKKAELIDINWYLQERGISSFKLINTFDSRIQEGSRNKEEIKTQLDWLLDDLQKAYLDYQLTINKRVLAALKAKQEDSSEKALSLIRLKERFQDILDSLLSETDKKIDRDRNELIFVSGGKHLATNQLSAGEKQLLIILMTVLIQDSRPSILLLDEPEISLHIDWQKKLIGYIRELNPNCQLIVATHSPAIIMEGWADHVMEVRDLITLDRNAVPQ